MNILSDVQNIFRDIFDDDELIVTENTTAKDIEDWDSLAQLNLVVSIEKHFKIRFQVKEIAAFKNVGDMLKAIERELAGKQ